MKRLVLLLLGALFVNIIGVATHNFALLILSVVMFVTYYVLKYL